jgi:hypothetical protein
MVSGYYGGYLAALSSLSGVAEQASRIDAQRQQMARLAQQDQLDAQTRDTLATAFQKQQETNQVIDRFGQEEAVADQYRNAGRRILSTNPQMGLNLMREGGELMDNTQRNRLAAAKVDYLKTDRLANLAGMVDSQETLDSYTAISAEQGRVVPPELQTWGTAAKTWLNRQAFAAGPQSKAATLALRQTQIEINDRREARLKEEAERKATDSARREAQSQVNQTARTVARARPANELALVDEVKALELLEPDGPFKSLPPATKREAIQDVYLLAGSLAKKMPGASPDEIKAEAQRQILQRVSPSEGIFGNAEYIKPGSKQSAAKGADVEVVNGVSLYRHKDGLYYEKPEGR